MAVFFDDLFDPPLSASTAPTTATTTSTASPAISQRRPLLDAGVDGGGGAGATGARGGGCSGGGCSGGACVEPATGPTTGAGSEKAGRGRLTGTRSAGVGCSTGGAAVA